MSSSTGSNVLSRPSFFEGQFLTAADLNASAHSQRALRWLHNRGLHNWGIAFGYELTGVTDERVVRIAPGYALDCQGRELVLGEPLELEIPPVSGPKRFALVAVYATDDDLGPVNRAGACGAMGAVRRPEQPILEWRDLSVSDKLPSPGIDIVLGSIRVSNCRLAESVSGAGRRSAKPETQPYVAAGKTQAGATDWELWPASTPVGVATWVNTASAGFRSVPHYQAQVVCERLAPDPKIPNVNNKPVPLFFAGYPWVTEPGSTGFRLRMVMPMGFVRFPGLGNSTVEQVALNQIDAETTPEQFLEMIATDLVWHVSWLGIEG
ncbi:hypothetical protein [Thiococcus pfennigii]|uniref:hypothetical protein n=1 Tax=Thiococcus pfennigii TaxID=1057 RepID=UPI001904109E|nr:hypothetical protein [Thiococcus pfennigii]